MARLNLKKVYKRFGKTEVIHGIDLDISDGEFVVFVGPSGCGKSTLLRMIAGLEETSEGDIIIDDEVVNEFSPTERGISMVFQSYALYPHMSVRQNMGFGLQMAKVEKTEIEKRVNNAARILQLEPLMDRKPKELSGGQRQRVAIGRSIVRDPKVFLFDEPLSNLDAKLRVQMRIEITKLHKKLGNTMIYVTHDQVEAMTMADKIVVLSDGYVEQVGSPLELYHAPMNKFVAGFIGSPKMNFLPVTVNAIAGDLIAIQLHDGQIISLPGNTKDLSVGDSLELGVRPEHLLLETQSDVSLNLNIEMREYLGGNTLFYCSDKNCDDITVLADGDISRRNDKTLQASVTLENLHLFNAEGVSLTAATKHQSLTQLLAA